MLIRTVSGALLIPAYLGVLVFFPVPAMAVALSVLAMIASFELLRATKSAEGRPCVYPITAIAAGAVPLLRWLDLGAVGFRGVTVLLVCGLFAVGIFTYGREKELKAEHILYALFAGLIIPSFLSCLLELRTMEHGQFLVLVPVVASVLTDVGAYFVGVLFGKHKGVTLVSPNKSAEGFIGGLLSGVVFMLAYALVLRHGFAIQVKLPVMALYGLVGSAVTMLGDLAYSLIKRQHGVKDYGHLIPGHGGILDRFDSLSFAAPVILILMELVPVL